MPFNNRALGEEMTGGAHEGSGAVWRNCSWMWIMVRKYVSIGRGAHEIHRPIKANTKLANVAGRG